jgi:riboflavin-specific deaminase-like protein
MIEITTLSELTIDGKLSLGPGASSKDLFDFYGDELRSWFHGERARCDAIMVGANTVRNDDPELTVRYCEGPSPLRVVPASQGRLPLDARLLNDGRPTLVAVSRRAADEVVAALAAKPNVEVVRCGDDQVDLDELMALLQARGVRSLIVEGGSRLLHSLFEADMVSKIIIKHIPVISGALDAPTYLRAGPERSALSLSRWRLVDWFVKSGVGVSIYRPLAAAQPALATGEFMAAE